MNTSVKTRARFGLALGALLLAGQALAQVTLYEREGFRGRAFATSGSRSMPKLDGQGFKDGASSAVVAGNPSERWEVCEDSAFRGRCVVLRVGEYPTLNDMGLTDRISSVRSIAANQRVADQRYAPLPAAPMSVASKIEFFSREKFGGRSFSADAAVTDFRASRFDDRASSIVVTGGPWEVCTDPGFAGRCTVLRPGQYPTLDSIDLDARISSARAVAQGPAAAPRAAANQIVFYEREGLRGSSLTATDALADFRGAGLNNRASSAVVTGAPWEVCQGAGFTGRCAVLRPGQYTSLAEMGLDDRVSSARIHVAAPPPQVAAVDQIVFYESTGFQGRSYTADTSVADLRRVGFDDRAASVVVRGNQWWEVCEDLSFSGRCVVLRPGQYPSLADTGLANRITSVRTVAAGPNTRPGPAVVASEIVLYEGNALQGRSFTSQAAVNDMRTVGFDDRGSSVLIRGTQWWEVCEDLSFSGRCIVLRPGQYASLQEMGMSNRITSLRPVAPQAGAQAAPVLGDYRRRDNERLFVADVTQVRAVLGSSSGQRCWVERGQVASERADPNVQGAVIGAVLGGILGHQVGGGTGRDIATGLGVLTGAAIGANTGRGSEGKVVQTQDVQRCSEAPAGARPAYYDVTYNFRGQEFRAQMSEAPGPTLTVNERGEPRV